VAAILVLAVFSSPPIANRLARAMELPAEESYRPDTTYDVVVLLGGTIEANMTGHEDPRVTRSYNGNVERLLATYDLLRRGQAKNAILSGGITESGAIEGQVLADQLADWGIDRGRLLVEGESLNTRDNATGSAAILHAHGFHTVLVVTSAMHVPRAHGCFRAVGIDVDMLPVDYRSYDPAVGKRGALPRAFALEESTAMIREAVGRVVYRLRGYSVGA
jgi:uncharacterized SAM-binding protein YcdF (DUF218 family)